MLANHPKQKETVNYMPPNFYKTNFVLKNPLISLQNPTADGKPTNQPRNPQTITQFWEYGNKSTFSKYVKHLRIRVPIPPRSMEHVSPLAKKFFFCSNFKMIHKQKQNQKILIHLMWSFQVFLCFLNCNHPKIWFSPNSH